MNREVIASIVFLSCCSSRLLLHVSRASACVGEELKAKSATRRKLKEIHRMIVNFPFWGAQNVFIFDEIRAYK